LHQAAPAQRVLLGAGTTSELPAEVDRAGMTKVVLVTSATLKAASSPPSTEVERLLGARHQATFTGVSEHTPESAVRQLQDLLEQTAADGVVSLGGGSVIDGCKAAIHAVGPERIAHLSIPTTLSGAEFTSSAGVTEEESRLKKGMRDPASAPQRVILDPEVTIHTPERLWLSTGIRALDHAVETHWAPEQDPLTILLAAEAIRRLRRGLPVCLRQPEDLSARLNAQVAAWWAALGLAGNTMGPSHLLGRTLGATFEIPHGITSCVFLPAVIEHMARSQPELVLPLLEPFEVSSPEEVGPACRDFISQLGLPVSLENAGLPARDLEHFIALVPAEWRQLVLACA
jgi:alcohol dehydrogenase class IV